MDNSALLGAIIGGLLAGTFALIAVKIQIYYSNLLEETRRKEQKLDLARALCVEYLSFFSPVEVYEELYNQISSTEKYVSRGSDGKLSCNHLLGYLIRIEMQCYGSMKIFHDISQSIYDDFFEMIDTGYEYFSVNKPLDVFAKRDYAFEKSNLFDTKLIRHTNKMLDEFERIQNSLSISAFSTNPIVRLFQRAFARILPLG